MRVERKKVVANRLRSAGVTGSVPLDGGVIIRSVVAVILMSHNPRLTLSYKTESHNVVIKQ
jgi:hypothetical protein